MPRKGYKSITVYQDDYDDLEKIMREKDFSSVPDVIRHFVKHYFHPDDWDDLRHTV